MTSELLAPAGDFETARAAFAAGADAVYCGLADYSARAFAKNFSREELDLLVRHAHADIAHPRRVYVTFNTLLDEDALEDAIATLAQLAEIAPDGVIVQDIGVARLCRRHFPTLKLHASTQMVAHNLEGVLALKEMGFTRVVLARELSCAEIESIAKRCGDVELECFIHGALCYSISGLCLFGALEMGRSGNRGKCPYCCRLPQTDAAGKRTLPFSMKDLRLGADVRKLVEAGVASLKIEGRMKSPLYVASVTRYYRDILDGRRGLTVSDLETVFSRRTTELYFNGKTEESPIDSDSLGHLGTEIGVVKRVTKDRDGLSWLRFHTARALEKHDGLQFEAMGENGRHLGMGIAEMRSAISRHPVVEVAAGTDVEVLLPDEAAELAAVLKSGMKIYCSMSNAVKRLFPMPSFRPSECLGAQVVDLTVTLTSDAIVVEALAGAVVVSMRGAFGPAKCPEKTYAAIEKAFSKFGGTAYRLGTLDVKDPDRLFVPMRLLNDVRRDLVEKLDAAREAARVQAIAAAEAELAEAPTFADGASKRRIKVRAGQSLPPGMWDEVIVSVSPTTEVDMLALYEAFPRRLALPVYTPEENYNKLRQMVRRMMRAGFTRWETADLAGLRVLKALGVTDITADWSLYAFNQSALAELSEAGVRRFVASPENTRDNLQYLAESGYAVEFLQQQSTPLFISLTQPGRAVSLRVFAREGLWVTTKPVPRTFEVPAGVSVRVDLSWDPPSEG